MNKLPNDHLIDFIQKNNLCHFKKVNLFGASNVGKKTLLSYIQHYSDNQFDFEIKKKEDSEEIKNDDSLLVECVKKLSIPISGNTEKLNINLYISNTDDLESIKNNLINILDYSECVIFMIDISSSKSFEDISELFDLVVKQMKSNIDYGEIPLFFISNKIDLEQNRDVSGFAVKELTDKYENINSFEFSLKLEKNASDKNINEFLAKLGAILSDEEKKYSFRYDSLNLVRLIEPISIKKDTLFKNVYNTLTFLLVGSHVVGKTSFAQKLINNTFSENTITTLGIDIMRTLSELYGELVKIELWDTAGQERLRSIPKNYYNKGDGFFMLFDVTNRKTFEEVSGWIEDIRSNRINSEEKKDFEQKPVDEVMVLIGNKIDETQKREVTREEAENLAKKYKVKYCEISCKLGINIYEIFCEVIIEASSLMRRKSTNLVINERKNKIENNNNPKKNKCC